MFKIRHADQKDVQTIAELEEATFPPGQVIPYDGIKERIQNLGNFTWLAEKDGTVVSHIGGLLSSSPDIHDDMYVDADQHEEDGDHYMILGIMTRPGHEGHGYARRVIEAAADDLGQAGIKEMILTCEEHLVPFYERLNFVNKGPSDSELGGVPWFVMARDLQD